MTHSPNATSSILRCAAWLLGCSIVACGWVGCAFQLDSPVDPLGGEVTFDAGQDAAAGAKDADAGAKDVDMDSKDVEAGAADGCSAPPETVLCTAAGLACGPLTTVDSCGNVHVVASCGACLPTQDCELGKCAPHTFGWKSSAWTACSKPCDGGTQTRDVWCERDDGKHVADTLCAAPKPETSQGCNTSPCCSPSCVSHDACGSNGCGGDCGTCVTDRTCREGYCVWDHGNNGTATCDTICSWGSSVCVDTSSDSCGVKADTTCYCW